MVARVARWPGRLHRPPARILTEIADRRSIVVLPFDDLTESPEFRDRLLGDIITEETTAALARQRIICQLTTFRRGLSQCRD